MDTNSRLKSLTALVVQVNTDFMPNLYAKNCFLFVKLKLNEKKYEPFIFKNESKQWNGYIVDILDEISRKLNITFTLEEMLSKKITEDTTNKYETVFTEFMKNVCT